MFEISPSIVTYYPSDRIDIQAHAIPTPVIWSSITNGTISATRTVDADTDSNIVIATSAATLETGQGIIQWTIDDYCRPTGSGYFETRVTVSRVIPSGRYRVRINPTNVEIRNNADSVIATITHTVASGDVFRILIASSQTFQLYINNVLKDNQTFTPTGAYSVAFEARLNPTVAAGTDLRIPQPVLGGIWDLRPTSVGIESWTLNPSHGTLVGYLSGVADGSNKQIYSGGTNPGIYTITAKIRTADDPLNLQWATSTINIPPLSIISEAIVTLQPGEKKRFATNYDAAQNAIVSWAVVTGGGSFSLGEYTAATAPGTSTIEASSGTQAQEITVIVPPTAIPQYTAAQPGEVIQFTSNIPSVTWTASCGSIGASGSPVNWTAPSQSGVTCKITASGSGYTKIVEMPVLQAFPYDPTFVVSWEHRKTVIVSTAEDRTRVSRVKDKNGLAYESHEPTFKNRTTTELAAVKAFYGTHHPGKRFIIINKVFPTPLRLAGYFDSDIAVQAGASCQVDYSFRFVEG